MKTWRGHPAVSAGVSGGYRAPGKADADQRVDAHRGRRVGARLQHSGDRRTKSSGCWTPSEPGKQADGCKSPRNLDVMSNLGLCFLLETRKSCDIPWHKCPRASLAFRRFGKKLRADPDSGKPIENRRSVRNPMTVAHPARSAKRAGRSYAPTQTLEVRFICPAINHWYALVHGT
jgi:hypothetical protein